MDSDPRTMSTTREEILRKLTPNTAGVMIVHIAGIVTDAMPDIAALCQERGLWLVEDAAHAHASRLAGRHAGTFGIAGSFSFYPTKVMTSAEGGSWIGSSAGLMVAAASPYVAWMSVTAGQAELTAAQVRVAAAAYETAYGLTVPPPVIAENRAELMILIATNLLGQNTPAIAVNEAEYGEMWAQDAAAMFGYAATAATATEALLPFEDAPLITNPGGLLEQAVAVEEAIDTAAANQLMNNVPQHERRLAGTVASDQSHELSLAHRHVDPAQDTDGTDRHVQAFNLEHARLQLPAPRDRRSRTCAPPRHRAPPQARRRQ